MSRDVFVNRDFHFRGLALAQRLQARHQLQKESEKVFGPVQMSGACSSALDRDNVYTAQCTKAYKASFYKEPN